MAKELLRRILPDPVWVFLRRRREDLIFALRRGFEFFGYNVARRRDFYSPLPAVADLERNVARWNRSSGMPGVSYDLEELERRLSRLVSRYGDEFAAHPIASEIKAAGFGPGFPAVDALTLYAMIRDLGPKRYLEVGSGVSTYFCSLAAGKNERSGRPLRIRCIEPNPYPGLRRIPGIELITERVQDMDLDLFAELEEGDVLFIDSSHTLRLDGDVPFLYLEVLPRLARGVYVHIHDIPFPYNVPYPAEHWVLKPSWPMFWNEAMVLQAFLCFNDRFEVVMSTPLLRHFDEAFLRRIIPHYESVEENPDTFSSIWLKKTA
jgi:hypothetical protein